METDRQRGRWAGRQADSHKIENQQCTSRTVNNSITATPSILFDQYNYKYVHIFQSTHVTEDNTHHKIRMLLHNDCILKQEGEKILSKQ